jgi:hypothetical protein
MSVSQRPNLAAGDAPPASAISAEESAFLMRARGWVLYPECLPDSRVRALGQECEEAYEACRQVQEKNGVATASMEGAAHHVVGYGGALDRFIEELPLQPEIERYFDDGKYIILTYGAAINPPGARPYTCKPHRDVRAYTSDYHLSLNMLVMLDDFTAENGATLILDGSHHLPEPPSTALFERNARQITGKAGDIVLFNSLVVHSAGPNRTKSGSRRCLTLCFGRPYVKPQIDFSRYLPQDVQDRFTPFARQLLGFNARVASSLEEYYQPMERWMFKADQR